MKSAEHYEQLSSQFMRSEQAPVVNALLAIAAAVSESSANSGSAVIPDGFGGEVESMILTAAVARAVAAARAVAEERMSAALKPLRGVLYGEDMMPGEYGEGVATLESAKPHSIAQTVRYETFAKTDTGKWVQIPVVASDDSDYIRSADLESWNVRIIWEP